LPADTKTAGKKRKVGCRVSARIRGGGRKTIEHAELGAGEEGKTARFLLGKTGQ